MGAVGGVAAGVVIIFATYGELSFIRAFGDALGWWWLAVAALVGVRAAERLRPTQRYAKLLAATGAGLVASTMWRGLRPEFLWEWIPSHLAPHTLSAGLIVGFFIGLREVLRPPYGAHSGEETG
jgi:hypothetical protein